ncbi:MAG TPA: 50S ribosomal protein L17 [Candidatus Paceibacterota bacterium]
MRRGKHRKFGRETKQRTALYRSLATALIEHGRITTTAAKAKSLSGYIDRMVTHAKKNTQASQRLLVKDLHPKAVKKLVSDVKPKFESQGGGYTRIIRKGQRTSDGSPMAIIEWSIK